jgi:hypothetical protein
MSASVVKMGVFGAGLFAAVAAHAPSGQVVKWGGVFGASYHRMQMEQERAEAQRQLANSFGPAAAERARHNANVARLLR